MLLLLCRRLRRRLLILLLRFQSGSAKLEENKAMTKLVIFNFVVVVEFGYNLFLEFVIATNKKLGR